MRKIRSILYWSEGMKRVRTQEFNFPHLSIIWRRKLKGRDSEKVARTTLSREPFIRTGNDEPFLNCPSPLDSSIPSYSFASLIPSYIPHPTIESIGTRLDCKVREREGSHKLLSLLDASWAQLFFFYSRK